MPDDDVYLPVSAQIHHDNGTKNDPDEWAWFGGKPKLPEEAKK